MSTECIKSEFVNNCKSKSINLKNPLYFISSCLTTKKYLRPKQKNRWPNDRESLASDFFQFVCAR
ncbi:MAG: hypothetical protein DRI57_17975 [Deltaproteobacteria bacterium]|nr:MAG: hypothetical protein DRI57_17975 [Deltaproteobacteria bacterium]